MILRISNIETNGEWTPEMVTATDTSRGSFTAYIDRSMNSAEFLVSVKMKQMKWGWNQEGLC